MNPADTATRRRSAADSRERLVSAAGELFSERGYDRTTVREIGVRAGVDPALIARYFGSKAELYLEALRRDGQPANIEPLDLTDPAAIASLLDRVQPRGASPTMYAAVRPHDDPALQHAAMDLLNRRFVGPTRDRAAALDHADLRAEIVAAALAGIVLSRTSGAFATLSGSSSQEVGRLVAQLLAGLIDA
jgi:AcrR family transcriptional regulator